MLSTALAASLLAPAAFGQSASSRDPAVENLQIRTDNLETALQRSASQAEQLGFQNNQLRKAAKEQADKIYELNQTVSAMDARLRQLEAILNAPAVEASSAASGPGEATVPLLGPTAPATREALAAERGANDASAAPAELQLADTPDDLFKQAKSLLLRGDYPAAETAFHHYVEKFSQSPQAAEAQYWLGESLLLQEAYPEASEAYIALVGTYPKSDKAADGFVKLARALRQMGEKAQACEALAALSASYPNASAVTRSLAASERSRSNCGTGN